MSLQLQGLLLDLISLPIPTIAAVTGHAAAAGMILALSHDYIVMRKDRGFLYMSELDLGLRISRWFLALVRNKIAHPADSRDVLLAASKVAAGMAKQMGVVDEAYDGAAETVAGAVRLAEEVLAAGGGEAYGEKRRLLMREVLEVIGLDETVEGEEEPPRYPLPTPKPRRIDGVSRL